MSDMTALLIATVTLFSFHHWVGASVLLFVVIAVVAKDQGRGG